MRYFYGDLFCDFTRYGLYCSKIVEAFLNPLSWNKERILVFFSMIWGILLERSANFVGIIISWILWKIKLINTS